MKLHAIEVENLNSLAGSHRVDLEKDLGDPSLFLILGPTGSGKTTLIDAVMLALFGQTPRLDKDSARDAVGVTDPRLVMTHGTGFCRARCEVSRMHPDGVRRRYRATWYVQRARKKAEGELQKAERTLEVREADGTWRVLAGGRVEKDLKPAFDALLDGRTADDFQRTMVLAQGQFAAFLGMDSKDRARLLEGLTGKSIYQRVGQQAHARYVEAKKELEQIETRVGEAAKRLLDEETRATLERARGAALALRDQHAAALEGVTHAMAAMAQCQTLTQDRSEKDTEVAHVEALLAERGRAVEEAEARQAATRTKRDAARTERERWAPEIAAAREARRQCDVVHGLVEEKRKAFEVATRDVVSGQEAVESARNAAARASREAEDAHRAREALRWVEPLVAARTMLESEIEAWRGANDAFERAVVGHQNAMRAVAALTQKLHESAALVAAATASKDQERAALHDAQVTLDAAIGTFTDLPAAREAWNTSLRQLGARKLTLGAAATAYESLHDATRKHEDADRARTQATVEAEAATGAVQDAEQRLTQAENVCVGCAQRLEDARWFHDLVGQLDRLHEGDECPVCGSTEHPARHAASTAQRRAEATAKRDAAQVAWNDADGARARAESTKKGADRALREAEKRLAMRQAEFSAAMETLARAREQWESAATAAALSPTDTAESIEFARHETESRTSAIQSDLTRLEAAEKEVVTARIDAEKALRDAETRAATHAEREAQCAAAVREQADAEAARHVAEAARRDALRRAVEAFREAGATESILADGGPVEWWKRTFEEIEAWRAAGTRDDTARERVTNAAVRRDEAEGRATQAGARADALAQALEQARARYAEAQAVATARLDGREPDAVEKALAHAVDAAEEELGEAARALGDAQQARAVETQRRDGLRITIDSLAARWTTAKETLDAALKTLGLDDSVSTTELENRAIALRTERDAANQEIGGIESRLEEDAGRRTEQAEAQEALAAARNKHDQWARLDGLIGTDNGGVFQRFALRLALDDLVGRANAHLRHLRPRYQLRVADATQHDTLAFAVRDAENPETLRPLTTLSGGETFLVSLALALGLAGYTSGTMPIETLLLDEGFGTLDEDSLDVAMSALESLRAQGRRIGVISHVASLRERIGARIVVEPLGAGRSRVRVDRSSVT